MSMINRKFFFDQARATLFAGKLSKPQVEGMSFILDVWEGAHADKDDRWLAYALGTTFHETAFTMQPIHEKGGAAYFKKMYDIEGDRPKTAKKYGNIHPGDGVKFHGRGFVQLTWRVNYEKCGAHLGVDLTSSSADADRALEKDLAAEIMFFGMETGLFTGVGFGAFFNGPKADWKNARKIINGLDHADDIAAYAKKFYAAISYTT